MNVLKHRMESRVEANRQYYKNLDRLLYKHKIHTYQENVANRGFMFKCKSRKKKK